ncbi:MAG: urease accessory UreF family protein [Pseudomonadota bacterium]
MQAEDATLTLQQWLSPSFPLGAFAYSHGLEGAVDMGLVHNEDTLRTWLSDLLHRGTGRCDAVWLREGYAAGEDTNAVRRLDEEARAFAITHSRLQESVRQGAAFARTLREVWRLDIPDLILPLAVGAGARRRGYDLELLVPLYLHAFVSNLVAATQRLLPIGQTAGQRVLVSLQSDCRAVAQATEKTGRSALYSNTFLSDIASMRQESLKTRIFQS